MFRDIDIMLYGDSHNNGECVICVYFELLVNSNRYYRYTDEVWRWVGSYIKKRGLHRFSVGFTHYYTKTIELQRSKFFQKDYKGAEVLLCDLYQG